MITLSNTKMNKESLTEENKYLLTKKAKESLYFFAKGILGFNWLVPDIHGPLCQILENHEIDTRVAVTLPRGWLKTTVCSCAYPIWRAIRNPDVKVLICQNTFTNACKKLSRISDVFRKNDLFKALFPSILPDSSCKWKADSLCVKRKGIFDESTFEAAGTRTQITSRHYDVIVEDDTVAPELEDLKDATMAPSKEDVQAAIGWHRLAIPLLVSPMKSQLLVVGTRWAELDLLSHIRDKEGSIYKQYIRAAKEDPAGNPAVSGECVYPSRFDNKTLRQIEIGLGPYMYASLYMNSPMKSEDMIFKPDWIKYFITEPAHLFITTTVDPAPPPGEVKRNDPDLNAITTTGKDLSTGFIYVLDSWKKRGTPMDVIDELFRQVELWNSAHVAIENVAYQSTLKFWIEEEMKKRSFYFNITGQTTGGMKKAHRIAGLQPLFASGRILLRAHMQDSVQQLLAFPRGVHDDLIDSLAMHIPMWPLTVSEKKEKLSKKGGPLSAGVAINQIRSRFEKKRGFPYDVMVGTNERVLECHPVTF